MKKLGASLPLLLVLVLWQAAAAENFSSSALPSPIEVVLAWYSLLASGDLVSNAAFSLYRSLSGLCLAIFIGGTIGVAMAWVKPIRVMFAPLVDAFYPLPKSALIPVTAVWLGLGDASKILLITMGCMLPVTLGAFNGAAGTEQVFIWSARSLGASRLQTLRDVVLPHALPELLNGIRTALALSFILLVSAEFISARDGLGYLIAMLGNSGAYDAMFAVVLTVAFIGFFADRAYQQFLKRALRWRG